MALKIEALQTSPLSWLEIDMGRLHRNIERISRVLGNEVGMIAIAKADGYGFGLVEVAQEFVASGITFIGVGTASDAHALRKAGIESRILVIYPTLDTDLPGLVAANIDITVTRRAAIDQLTALARQFNTTPRLHIQVETGMHHYGADPELAVALASAIAKSPLLTLAGISTHFSASENKLAFTKEQHAIFMSTLRNLAELNISPEMIHCANSVTADKFPTSWNVDVYRALLPNVKVFVRLGCLFYGTYRAHNKQLSTDFIATSLVTHVLELKEVDVSDSIGYFNSFKPAKKTVVAILPIGWGSNGFFPENAHVLLGGFKAPIVGPISANTCVVDVSNQSVRVGDEVILFGKSGDLEITFDQLAAQHGTFMNRLISIMGNTSIKKYTKTMI